MAGAGVAMVLTLTLALPSVADAHGPIAPVASSYFAKVLHTPVRLEPKVVDGDLRMWLRVPANETVVVLDYQGAPYLRFSPAGVAVNHNSAMYYLNQTPFAQAPPATLTASTPPSWHVASGGHVYEWHDGRLHALAAVAIPPGAGTAFVGRWKVPVRINGELASIDGGLWHAGHPSIVWFWPIAVLLACVLAAWRLRRRRVDLLLARSLASVALIALVVGAVGHQLHGRPAVTIFQVVELVAIVAFAAWGLWRMLLRRPGYLTCFLVAAAAIWEGGVLITTLLDGFVLIAEPAFLARATTVTLLGCGVALLLFVFRRFDQSDPDETPVESVEGLRPSKSVA